MTLIGGNRGACRHTAGEVEQEFGFLLAIEGSHVTSEELYSSATLAFPEHYERALGYLDELRVQMPGRQDFKLTVAGDQVHFSVETPCSFQDVDRHLVNPLRFALMLSVRREVFFDSFFLTTADGKKVMVRRKETSPESVHSGLPPEVVVALADLGATGLQRWYALFAQLTPVPSLVAKTIVSATYDVETRVLSLAASAEAVQRELYGGGGLPRTVVRQIRQAAVDAAPEAAKPRVREVVGALSGMTFAERLRFLCDRLADLAPDVVGVDDSREEWIRQVKAARNGFAHLTPRRPEDLFVYSGQLYVLYESLSWLLTLGAARLR